MTVKDLMEKLNGVPPETEIRIFNSGTEWYGVAESVSAEQFKQLGECFVINFGLDWSDVEEERYFHYLKGD